MGTKHVKNKNAGKTSNGKNGFWQGNRIKLVIVSVFVLAALVTAICGLSSAKQPEGKAFTSEKYEMGTDTFNYFFRDCYDSFQNAYGEMIMAQGTITSGKSLAEQQYSEDMTWADFFYQVAAGNAIRYMTVYIAAQDAGYVLPDSCLADIDDEISAISTYAESFGYESPDAFLKAHYGDGADMDSYRSYLEMKAAADQYSNEYYNSISSSREELDQWFSENYPDAGDSYNYNSVDFRMVYIPFYDYSLDSSKGYYDFSDESKKAVKQQIEEVSSLYEQGDKTEESFIELVKEYSSYNRNGGGLYEKALKDDESVETQVRTWIFDDSRSAGDTSVIEADSGDYFLYWVGENVSAKDLTAQEGLSSEAWNEWYTSLAGNVEITENDDILKKIYLIA